MRTSENTSAHAKTLRFPFIALQINKSDNVHFHFALSPSFFDWPLPIWFCLLNTYDSGFTLVPCARLPAFLHLFLSPQLESRASSPRLITSIVPSPLVSAHHSRSFTGIISPLHFHNLGLKKSGPLLNVLSVFNSPYCSLKQRRYLHLSPILPTFSLRHLCSSISARRFLTRDLSNANVSYPFVTYPAWLSFLRSAQVIHSISTYGG